MGDALLVERLADRLEAELRVEVLRLLLGVQGNTGDLGGRVKRGGATLADLQGLLHDLGGDATPAHVLSHTHAADVLILRLAVHARSADQTQGRARIRLAEGILRAAAWVNVGQHVVGVRMRVDVIDLREGSLLLVDEHVHAQLVQRVQLLGGHR